MITTYVNANQLYTLSERLDRYVNTDLFHYHMSNDPGDAYPFGPWLESRDLFVLISYTNRPGHVGLVIDRNGDVVREWEGGLD